MKEIKYIPGREEDKAVTAQEFDRLYRNWMVHLSSYQDGILRFESLPDTCMDDRLKWDILRVSIDLTKLDQNPTFFCLYKPFVVQVGRLFPAGTRPIATAGRKENYVGGEWVTEAWWSQGEAYMGKQ